MPIRTVETISEALARWSSTHLLEEGGQRVYLSTPITTGRRFIDWWEATGRLLEPNSAAYKASYLENVRTPNEADACVVASGLNTTSEKIRLVNPVDFPEPFGWDQATFHTFWTEVIRRYVHQVVFVDGWEFSVGCCREFAAAIGNKVPCLDQRGLPLTPVVGRRLLARARKRLANAAMETTAHDMVLAHLELDANEPKKDHA